MASRVKPKMRQFWKWLDDGPPEEAVISIAKMGMHVAICSRAFDNHSSMRAVPHVLLILLVLAEGIQRLYESQTHGAIEGVGV